jgi:5'-AMP-activated protein kinase catalytic alpha subunit
MSKSPIILDKHENNINNYCKEYLQDINILKNDINQYQINEIIGEGMFGKVKLAIHLLTNEKVAIKIFDKGKIKTKKEKEYIEREIAILKKLNHYNTIKLYNIIQNDDFIFLIQEYICGKELLHYIESNDNLSEKDICRLYQQIISGIEYMHEMGIAHRDLKLENILLNYKKDIKIIDFGLSNRYDRDTDELLHSSCGSPCYAAPEMIKGLDYHGINTDIWSSGIILYLMLCKKFPFNDKNNSKLYQKILSGKFVIPNYLSNEAKDLIINLLKVNPKERIKMNGIKDHPWFNLINKNNNYCKGLDIYKTVLPIDMEIIKEMDKYGIDKSVSISNILRNNFNNITTTYNLLLQKKIRNGRKSVSDFVSDLYINYINDERNKFSYFNNDIELIIKNRINANQKINNIRAIPPINIEYGFNSKTFGYNYNKPNICNYTFLFGKTTQKIRGKSDEYTNRQTTDRQKDINILLNFPIKFHTIDHDSYSNSKKKKANIKLKNKSPNLTQFHSKKNNHNIQHNINTIKINGYTLNRYRENPPSIHHYAETKKSNDLYLNLLNKKTIDKQYIKLNNFQNYKQYLFNKSVDNKLSKEKHNGINNYINLNNNKFNKLIQIRKKIREPVEIKKNQKTIDDIGSNTPIKTEADKINYTKKTKDNSFIRPYNNFHLEGLENKALISINKKKTLNGKIKNKININGKIPKMNNNYIINKKNIAMGLSFNNNKDINNYGIENNIKRNNFFFEERENKHKILSSLSQQKDKNKDKKKVKTKKATSLSIDSNIRNQSKNDMNIFTNKPKRKNVMKFINKNNNNNNNNDINGNFKFNNIYNKYGYFYKNEIKKNIYNKSLDMNNNYKKLNVYS